MSNKRNKLHLLTASLTIVPATFVMLFASHTIIGIIAKTPGIAHGFTAGFLFAFFMGLISLLSIVVVCTSIVVCARLKNNKKGETLHAPLILLVVFLISLALSLVSLAIYIGSEQTQSIGAIIVFCVLGSFFVVMAIAALVPLLPKNIKVMCASEEELAKTNFESCIKSLTEKTKNKLVVVKERRDSNIINQQEYEQIVANYLAKM